MKSFITLLTFVLIHLQADAQTYKPVFAKPLLVGIGASPTGSVTINANPASTPFSLQLPLDDGTADQVLATDGTGTLSWTTLVTALTHFTEAVTIAAPNATTPVASLTATNAATDVDAALIPKGTGALLGAIPDNAATGGDKRGTYAVDWQLQRTVSTQVASGSHSTISGGGNNTATSNFSTISGGENNSIGTLSAHTTIGGGINNDIGGNAGSSTVNGGSNNDITDGSAQATISGGLNNTVTNSWYASIGGGSGNTIGNTSDNATIGGGISNNISLGAVSGTISGGQSNTIGSSATSTTIGGGFSNSVGAGGATISGGRNNVANGQNAAIPGGRGLTLSGASSFGYLGNNINATRNATVTAANIVFFGNTDLWLGNNDNTPRALRFYEAQNTSGAFPAAGTNFAAIVAPVLGTDYTLTLPVDDGTADQVLTTNGSGTLSWTDKHILSSATDDGNDAGITLSNAGVIRISPGAATGNFNATLPAGTDGQIMYVHNNSGFQVTETGTGTVIGNGGKQIFVKVPTSGWQAF